MQHLVLLRSVGGRLVHSPVSTCAYSPVSPSLLRPCVTVCHHISTGVYFLTDYKRTSPFKSAGASVQSTTGSRGVCISGSNAGYTMFRGRVKGTGYPLHSPVSPSHPLPCVNVCHHISTEVWCFIFHKHNTQGEIIYSGIQIFRYVFHRQPELSILGCVNVNT